MATTLSFVDTKPSGGQTSTAISTTSDDFYKLVVSDGRVYHVPTGIHFDSSDPLSVSPFMLGLAERLSKRIETVAGVSAAGVSTALSNHILSNGTVTSNIQVELTAVSDALAIAEGNITTLQNDVVNLTTDLGTAQGDIGVIQGQITGIDSAVTAVSSALVTTSDDVETSLNRLLYTLHSGTGRSEYGAIARMSNYLASLSRAAPVYNSGTTSFWFARQYRAIDQDQSSLTSHDLGLITAVTAAEAETSLSSDATAFSAIFGSSGFGARVLTIS